MRTWNVFSLVLGSFLLVAPGRASATPIYAPLAASNTVFAVNLYGQLATSNTGNVIFSPYSVSACLGMVYDGARGETARQMAQALDFSTNQAEVGTEFGALLRELDEQQGQGGIDLSIANGLWGQTNFPFLPAFLGNASNNFDASVQQVNFVTDAAEITDQINQWVAEQTEEIITNLFAPGMLNSSTVLALVNAIYFKGAWETQFPTNNTLTQPFYVSSTATVSAPLMQQTFTNSQVGFYHDNLLQAVELPYGDSNLTMVVLLPNDTDGLPQVESALAQELPAALSGLSSFRPSPLPVALPRFSLTMGANLIPPLENLGMIDAFGLGADFSGIDGLGGLLISAVTHKAAIDVDESGTVAAAATGVGIITSVSPFYYFRADHPFIFLIYDTNSASVLFMGRVVDPTDDSGTTNASHPLIQTSGGNFGINGNQFGFNVAGTNATMVVEACTNMAANAWSPVTTLTLTNGSAYFSEAMPTNTPNRFYRVRSQ